VYFITSNLDPKSLKDFYGSGALPINYPNAYDARRGKTGSGIWLHGTPPNQFARAPKATDGCVVLANPDLERIISTVEVRTTPVVIAQQPAMGGSAGARPAQRFETALEAWRARPSPAATPSGCWAFTAPTSPPTARTWRNGRHPAQRDRTRSRAASIELKDLSLPALDRRADTMVVTFGEVAHGARSGASKRQYWVRQGSQWKIFYEGVIRMISCRDTLLAPAIIGLSAMFSIAAQATEEAPRVKFATSQGIS
jgi:L,D-transpeptidase YnhG